MMRHMGWDRRNGMKVEMDGDAVWGTRSEKLKRISERGGLFRITKVRDEIARFALNAGDETAAVFQQ